MDLRTHFAAMWRHKWVVLVLSVVAAGVTFGVLSGESKVYQATAQLNVIAGQAENGQQPLQDATPFLAQTYATLAQTRPVLADAARRSGLHINEDIASTRVSVLTPGGIGYLQVAAKGPTPQAATALDSAASQALVDAVNAQQQQALQTQVAPIQNELQQLGSQLSSLPSGSPQRSTLETQYQAVSQSLVTAELQPLNRVVVVSPAGAGASPVAPQPPRYAVLAFVTALVVLAELSVGYEAVSDRFSRTTSDEELQRLTGLPVLARIPRSSVGPDLVEAFRMLRTSLLFTNGAGKSSTVAIVSSAPEVGKSFVAINLAASLADLEIRAALVDGDMRRPVVARRLGIGDSPGLSEVLEGAEVRRSLVTFEIESGRDLFVMPAGAPSRDPAGLLTSHLVDELLAELKGFDAVIIDTPAESMCPDASVIAAHCDAAVLVIDATSTTRRSLRGLLDRLNHVGAHPIGIVVNRATETGRSGRYYTRAGYDRRRDKAERVSRVS